MKELEIAMRRLVDRISAAFSSAVSGLHRVTHHVSDEISMGVDNTVRADKVNEAGIAMVASELRAPTDLERRRALATVAESQMPFPKMFNSPELDSISGVKLHIALESRNLSSLSVKERAARVVFPGIANLPPGKSLYLASSGNHAIAYAEAARRRGIPLTAVVPENTSPLKVDKLKSLGANVVRHGPNWDAANEHAKRINHESGGLFMDVSAPDSVAALGTAVHDMVSQRHFADAVILPGGGGTIASAAQVVRDYGHTWRRDYTILIACPESAPTLYESFKAGAPVTVTPHTMAEAMQVATVDAHLLSDIVTYADDVVLVPERWIEQGIPLLSNATGRPIEGAGVVAPMAVLGSHGILHGASGTIHDLRGQEVVTMASGGSIAQDAVDAIHIDKGLF
jgi:threonine dehydratase